MSFELYLLINYKTSSILTEEVNGMDGYKRRQEQKKQKIYQAALELFSKKGVQEVKITEIAAKAQVSPVTIYNYFGNKTGLLRQVIFKFMDEQWKLFHKIVQKDMPFPEKIESIIFGKKETAKNLHPEFILLAVSKDPEIRNFLQDFYKNKSLPMLMEIIQQGREEGYVEQGISTKTILFYISMFWDILNRPEIAAEEDRCIQLELATLFFYGLMGKPNK